MSLNNLGNKQIIVLHNCEINNEAYDLVITPHKQTIGYIRTKRQTKKRNILSKKRQITRKRFSKRRNAVSESEVSNLDALCKLKETVNKNYPVHDQLYFSDSEATSHSSKQGKRRIKKIYKNKPVCLYSWNQPIRHIEHYALTVTEKMSQSPSDESLDEDSVFPFIISSPTEDRGQRQFCTNLIANVFEQGSSPCKAEFPEVKIKRQIIDLYLKRICNLTQPYGIYTIEFSTESRYHSKHVIQTDDVDIEFSKLFTEYIKNIQQQNSQRANSIFTNDVFYTNI